MKSKLLLSTVTLMLGATPMRGAEEGAEHAVKFESAIQRFEQTDREHLPQPGDVLFIGDSGFTRWTSLEQDLAAFRAVNRGFGGSYLGDSVYYLERIIGPHQPRMIVVMAGGNDLAGNVPPSAIVESVRQFIVKARALRPGVPIAFVSVAPSIARWKIHEKQEELNRQIQAACADAENVIFIDRYTKLLGADGQPRPELYSPDNLHLNAQGYALEVELFTPYLKAVGATSQPAKN